MNHSLSELNELIRKEADEILYQKGLLSILEKYGTVKISGSYQLDLMTWRDLDIYLGSDEITESGFFDLGSEILNLLQPVKMSYRNERGKTSAFLPDGLYWGIYLGNERAGAWKIDIWAVNFQEQKRLLQYGEDLKSRLNPENREKILEIKSQCWKNPQYRRSFSSTDIYQAVLEKGISDFKSFTEYLKDSL
jgi:hypothetical protein